MKTDALKDSLTSGKVAFVRVILAIGLLGSGLSELKAAIMWNWVSEGEGNIFSGSLTTDGDYSDTQGGTGNVTFTVLSYDSWFLNGTNLITAGPFEQSDWQTVGAPVFDENGERSITSSIVWSRDDQKLDPVDGLSALNSPSGIVFRGSTLTQPGFGGAGPLGHAELGIAIPSLSSGINRNSIKQHPFSGGEEFDLNFIPTSTVFTPVPEPNFVAGITLLGSSLFVLFRRMRSRADIQVTQGIAAVT